MMMRWQLFVGKSESIKRMFFAMREILLRIVNTKAYKNAHERAGIQDFTWHDLRHTWASWHVQNGTPHMC